jgi:hypothetical protein
MGQVQGQPGQEFVIGGYTPGNPFDVLIVGYYDGDRLLYGRKLILSVCPKDRDFLEFVNSTLIDNIETIKRA